MTNWVESYFDQNPENARFPVVARSRFSLHLRRAGRRRLALVTGAPMHYYAPANREWLPLDTRLQPTGDGRFRAPGLPFALGRDGAVAVGGNLYRHRTWRVGIFANGRFTELSRLGTARLAGDRLIREGRTQTEGLRHEITLLPGGIHEELRLLEAPKLIGNPGDLFAVETLLPTGGIPAGLVKNKINAEIYLPQGWAQDAAGLRIPLLRWADPTGRRLYSGVPLDWLAEAEYPVVLDPDIDIIGNTADGYIEGPSVSTSTTFDSSGASIHVGGGNVSGPSVWRGYVKFNTSSLGPESSVERVNLQMYPTLLNDYVAWTIYVRQYDWSANDPMAAPTREAAWDGLGSAANSAVLATSTDPLGTPVVSEDLPTNWVELEGNTYYGLWCNQEGFSYPSNEGGQHQYSSAEHSTPSQRPLLRIEYLGSYPHSGPVPLRAILPAPRVLLADTRVILRSRERRTALNARIKVK